MKKTLRMLLLVLVLCLGLVMPAAAETTDGFASDHICMADMAGVLNEREVTELETMIDEIRTRQKFDIAILTVSEEDIPSVEEYADDIYGYVMTCYNLLSNEEKTMFYEDIKKELKKYSAK